MQITPSRVATTTPPAAPPAAPPPPPAETAPQPQDGFMKTAGRSAGRTAVAWGNAMGTVAGGAGALTLTTGALYAGVLGGAVAGSAFGLGLGPVVGALGSSGALNFLGNTFSTAGIAAKAGIVLGGAAMAAGAWDIGSALGNAVGKPVGALVGLPVGFAKGAWSSFEGTAGGTNEASAPAAPRPKPAGFLDLNEMSGVTKLYATALGGAGLITGGIGGALLGASATSATNLVSGLLAQNVTLASITGAAMVGAAVGGGLGAVIGGRGGFKLAKTVQSVVDWAGEKLVKKPAGSEPTPTPSEGTSAVGQASATVGQTSKHVGANLGAFFQHVSPYRLGLNVADVGVGLAQSLSGGEAVQGMGYALGAAHAGWAFINAVGAAVENEGSNGDRNLIQCRLFTAAGDGMIAGGHFAAAAGAGAWALPIIGAGMVLNNVADYRYTKQQ